MRMFRLSRVVVTMATRRICWRKSGGSRPGVATQVWDRSSKRPIQRKWTLRFLAMRLHRIIPMVSDTKMGPVTSQGVTVIGE
ncbi:hypothetical protein J2W14_000589 [Pseudarthrobacter oxydans]|nr:hypothetical protein [Pseudarthrobacter oxydans]